MNFLLNDISKMATEFKKEKWANTYAEGIKIGDLSLMPVIKEELSL